VKVNAAGRYVSLDTVVMGSVIGYCTALAARKADPDDPL
jgi:hypothetical protein